MNTTLRTIASVALAGAAAALLSAPIASADTSSFLDELSTNNAAPPGMTPSQIINAGYATCGRLRGGGSILDEMSAVEQTYHFSQGTLFVSAATTNLCPDFAG